MWLWGGGSLLRCFRRSFDTASMACERLLFLGAAAVLMINGVLLPLFVLSSLHLHIASTTIAIPTPPVVEYQIWSIMTVIKIACQLKTKKWITR